MVVRAIAWVIVGCLALAGASASRQLRRTRPRSFSGSSSRKAGAPARWPIGWLRCAASRSIAVRDAALDGRRLRRCSSKGPTSGGVPRGGGHPGRGIPLSCALPVRGTDQCRDARREPARCFRGTVADGRPPTGAASRTDALRGADGRLDGGTGDGRPRGATDSSPP